MIKEVYSNPVYDVSSISLAGKNRNYELDYINYEGERGEIIPVSKFYKEVHNKLKSEFGDKDFSVVSSDDNDNKFLVVVSSDKLYGTYYEYDTKTKKTKLLYDLMPQLKPEDMAEMRPITFKSRDGLTIHGYITLPKAALEGKKVPLVVNPHGGPQKSVIAGDSIRKRNYLPVVVMLHYRLTSEYPEDMENHSRNQGISKSVERQWMM